MRARSTVRFAFALALWVALTGVALRVLAQPPGGTMLAASPAATGLGEAASPCDLPLILNHYPPLPTATHTPEPTATRTPAPVTLVTCIPLGAPEGVAADRATGRVYVADNDTNSIVVIDDASQTVVQTFPVDGNVVGLAYDPATNRLFTGYSWPIRVLDAATGAQLDTIDESLYGDHEIAINPVNRKIYLGDWSGLVGSPDKVLIYDADTLHKLGEVSLGVDPSFQRVGVAVNPVTGMAYGTYTAFDEVTFIDGHTNQAVRTVPLAEGEDIWLPPGVTVDATTNRVYVQCAHETVVLDGTSGERLGTIPGYYGTRVNPDDGHLYQGVNNRFRILDGDSFAVLGQLTLPGYMGYGGIDLILSSRRIYLSVSYADQVAVIQD